MLPREQKKQEKENASERAREQREGQKATHTHIIDMDGEKIAKEPHERAQTTTTTVFIQLCSDNKNHRLHGLLEKKTLGKFNYFAPFIEF